jgi:hypothetical protein
MPIETLPLPLLKLSNEQALRTILGDAEGYIVFTQKQAVGWVQLGALPTKEAGRIYEILGKDNLTDVYFTVNSFYRVGKVMGNGLRKVFRKMRNKKTGEMMLGTRQECNLQDLRCFYVDMDIYRHGKAVNWRDATALVQKMADKGIVPHPTVFANSGRGAYALWAIKPHESKKLDLDNYKAINKALQQEFKAYSFLLEPDDVFDGSRVLRLPGSINSKAPDNPVAYVMQASAAGNAYEYTLEEVAEKLSVPLLVKNDPVALPVDFKLAETPFVKSATPIPFPEPRIFPKKEVNAKLSEAGKKGMESLGKRRLKELIEIIKLKGVHQGFRYKALFILASTARIAKYTKENAVVLLKDLAETFKPPYPGTDANDVSVGVIVGKAYEGKIMKHSGQALAKFFNLSAMDCRYLVLRTIFSSDIAPMNSINKRADKEMLKRALEQQCPGALCLLDLCKRVRQDHGISLSKSQASRLVRKYGLSVGKDVDKITHKAA